MRASTCNTGGTFDQWADDVRAFPVESKAGRSGRCERSARRSQRHQLDRLRDGLERNISLVIAKSVIACSTRPAIPSRRFASRLEFGARNRRAGWGGGLTTLTCLANLSKHLRAEDRPRAMFHGISEVASDCDGHPPRFPMRPLPGGGATRGDSSDGSDRFVEVRDTEGAERCIASAVRDGCDRVAIADMLFAAATDHRYLTIGHALDFTNKALESLDLAGWDLAEPVLTSLAPVLSDAAIEWRRRNSWRNPIDLVQILETRIRGAADGTRGRQAIRSSWSDRERSDSGYSRRRS